MILDISENVIKFQTKKTSKYLRKIISLIFRGYLLINALKVSRIGGVVFEAVKIFFVIRLQYNSFFGNLTKKT